MKKVVLCIAVFAVAVTVGITANIILKNAGRPENLNLDGNVGVWWWDNRIDETYLDFAKENGVNEIYYYTSSFGEKTSDFIEKANIRQMKVFWLSGEYQWIEDSSPLHEKISEYMVFQQESPFKFDGIHLDIEPHQHPDFKKQRTKLITDFISLTAELKNSYPSLFIEYDIPFWLQDEIQFDGKTKPAYQFVIDNASRVTVMSYRDDYQKICDIAKEEKEYALTKGKAINYGVETGVNDDDIVTFREEGLKYMYQQLRLLKSSVPKDCGIAIHHIKSWREMKD